MDDESILDIDDPQVPVAILEHAARFRVEVRHVVLDGPDFYLFAEDGELVDLGYLN